MSKYHKTDTREQITAEKKTELEQYTSDQTKCVYTDCQGNAEYGFIGKSLVYCEQHSYRGMCRERVCFKENCGQKAVFGRQYRRHIVPVACAEHTSDNLVPVVCSYDVKKSKTAAVPTIPKTIPVRPVTGKKQFRCQCPKCPTHSKPRTRNHA